MYLQPSQVRDLSQVRQDILSFIGGAELMTDEECERWLAIQIDRLDNIRRTIK